MEKRNRKAGHSYSLRDRILAQIMVIIVTLTMIPFDSLVVQAASTTTVKSVGSIRTEYEVDYGTSKDDIGLPSELSVILETVISSAGATNGGTEYSEDAVDESVSWEGYYDGDTPGTYALTAEFDDGSLYYDNMPTVKVTVREPETASGSNADDEGEDDEDPDQPVVTGETGGQSTENGAKSVTVVDPETVLEAAESFYGDDAPAAKSVTVVDPETVLEAAESFYGDDAPASTAMDTIHVTITPKDDITQIKAGEYLTYEIKINCAQAAWFAYDGQSQKLMFTDWNINSLDFTLPDTIEYVGFNNTYISSVDDSEAPKYSIELKDQFNPLDASNGDTIILQITCRVKDNGILPANTELGDVTAHIDYDFDVKLNSEGTLTHTYQKEDSDTANGITAVSDDDWKVIKSSYEDVDQRYTIDKEHNTITFHYLVEFGLKIGETMSKEINDYTVVGRIPFTEDPMLTDSALMDRFDGMYVNPQKITLTPVKSGYVYYDETKEADGSDGKPTTIDLPLNGQAIAIPHDTCGANVDSPAQLKTVDPSAPFYSAFDVDVVYEYEQFLSSFENNIAPEDAVSEDDNDVRIDFKMAFADGPDERYTEEDAQAQFSGYIYPVKLKIAKNIVNYDNNTGKPYDSNIKAPISGPATYEILDENGDAAVLYKKTGDFEFEELSTNVLTINPNGAVSDTNGTNGTIEVYAKGGVYTVNETGAPVNTYDITPAGTNANKSVKNADGVSSMSNIAIGTFTFNNKENLGQVKIRKVDEANTNKKLQGAVFELYRDAAATSDPVTDEQGNTIQVTTANATGEAVFTRLVPGNYYLKEVTPPSGYVIIGNGITPVEVTAGNTEEADIEVITNHLNGKAVRLQKQYKTVTDGPNDYRNVGLSNFTDFETTFKLQYKLDGVASSDWQYFKDSATGEVVVYSLDNDGTTSQTIPEYITDETGTHKVIYRWEETIPEGYKDESGTYSAGEIVYSNQVIPANFPDTQTLVMKNQMEGVVKVTKKKATLNPNNGTYSEASASGIEFALYRAPEGSTVVSTAEGEYWTGTTDAEGQMIIKGLASASGSTSYVYYLVETNLDDDFSWATDAVIKVDGVDTPAVNLGTFANSTDGVIETTQYNIDKNIPITVVKVDKFDSSKKLQGATISISATGEETKTVTTGTDGTVLTTIEIGKNYRFTETAVPDGYYLDAQPVDINATNWKVVRKDDGTYEVQDANGASVAAQQTVTFADTPYTPVSVTKKVKAEGAADSTATTLTGVQFEIYQKVDGQYVRYGGDDFTITAGGGSVALPEGTYYLHEIVDDDDDIINPDVKPSLYTGGQLVDGKYYFGPYNVPKATSGTTTFEIPTIMNINNHGALRVKKKLYKEDGSVYPDDTAARNLFAVSIYRVGEDGQLIDLGRDPIKFGSKPHGSPLVTGEAVFEDLPVYDEDGEKIEYVVKEEELSAGLAKLYYIDVEQTQPITIESGTDSTNAADAGFVVNREYTKAIATKKYYDVREHMLTGDEYKLEGATIALYKKVIKEDQSVEYQYVGTTVTNAAGQAIFSGLIYMDYVAIEVDIPASARAKHMFPYKDGQEKNYLEPDASGNLPGTLTDSDLADLNWVLLGESSDPTPFRGTIYNVIPWTQIRITKYNKENYTSGLDADKLNGSDFVLWMQVLPADADPETPLVFNFDDKSGYTQIGQYTSGVWYFNGAMQKGQFQTDVLSNDDNVVYWLEEVRPTTGYSMVDSQRIILFRRQGTLWTNNSLGGAAQRVVDLVDNQINEAEVYNATGSGPGPGPGEGTESWALIKFSKWGERKDGSYILVPNATFNLWAVTESGDKVLLLDTITTGNENVPGGGATTGHGFSVELNAFGIWDELTALGESVRDSVMEFEADSGLYPDDPEPGNPYKPNGDRKVGTFYLKATLIETDASSVYEMDDHSHNLMIAFPHRSKEELYVGNDKYFVTNRGNTNINDCDVAKEASAGGAPAIDMFDNGVAGRHIAIVNHIAQNRSVVFRHFGYDPEVVGYNMTHDKLETDFADHETHYAPVEAEFALQRYDPSTKEWQNWDYHDNDADGNNKFIATGNGFVFPDGLIDGQYRAFRTKEIDGYENFYEDDKDTEFYFTVGASDRIQVFTTYSPEKPDLEVAKTNLNGNKITDKVAVFTLTPVGGEATAASTVDGTAVFYNLDADTKYVLAETQAPEGYTNEYFKELFTQAYSDYAALVTSAGYNIGYETEVVANGESYGNNGNDKAKERVIINKEGGYQDQFTLSAKNVEKVKLKITKKDAETEDILNGAEFQIFYKKFDTVSGTYTVPAFGNTALTLTSDQVTTGTLKSDNTVVATNGTVVIEGLNPGAYLIKETKAPGGYDLAPSQTIVITGGLPITVSPATTPVYAGTTAAAAIEFEDVPRTGLTIEKAIDPADYPFADDYSETFKFKLTNGTTTVTGNPDTATVSVVGESLQSTKASYTDLSQNTTYYLEELLTDAQKDLYTLTKVEKKVGSGDWEEVTAQSGKYPIELTESTSVQIRVTNKLNMAKVTFFKYDGDEDEPIENGLAGAQFEIVSEDKQTVVVSSDKIVDEGKGVYSAEIPLSSEDGTTFYIHEIQSPDPDVFVVDIPNSYVEVADLKPGDAKSYIVSEGSYDETLMIPNYGGAHIDLVKYGDVSGHDPKLPLDGAYFQMYFSVDNGVTWTPWGDPKKTENGGQVSFLILEKESKKYQYAIAEVSLPDGYVGLEGLYKGTTKITNTTIAPDGKTVLYILGDAFTNGQHYAYNAYNIHYLRLIVEKEDYPKTVQKPVTEFTVYEVLPTDEVTLPSPDPNTGYIDVDRETAMDLIDNYAVAGSALAGTTANVVNGVSSFENDQFLLPGKYYVAVETHADDLDSSTDDYSIILDDRRVVSYKVFYVEETDYNETYTVRFVNVKGSAEVGIEKEVNVTSIDSLLEKDAALIYTIKPSAGNDYPLDAFKVDDTGITVSDPDDYTPSGEWYSFGKVTLGQAGMDTFLFGADAQTYPIYAKVTFVDFEGNEYCNNPDTYDVRVDNAAGQVVEVPASAAGKNIKSFYVEYFSTELKNDTKDATFAGYALGQNFSTGDITVDATVYKQSETENSLRTIKEITNTVKDYLTYSPWSSEGERQDPITIDATASVPTPVGDLEVPRIHMVKDGPDPDEPITVTAAGQMIEYTITVTNETGKDVDFKDPVVADLLPKGMTLDHIEVTSPEGIEEQYAMSTGNALESKFFCVRFNGELSDGESIVITVFAKASSAVTKYGMYMRNFACVTSKDIGVITEENQTGAVIQNPQGQWAGELVETITHMGCDDGRANAFKEALNEIDGLGNHGFIVDWHENYWNASSGITLVKGQYGPYDDPVYREDIVSIIQNLDTEEDRTLHYQLTVNNTSDLNRTNLTVMDVLPMVKLDENGEIEFTSGSVTSIDGRINNGSRNSKFNVGFGEISSVRVVHVDENGNETSTEVGYTTYYYSGDVTGYKGTPIAAVCKEAQSGVPNGWTTSKPDNVTAFIVATDFSDPANAVVLEPGDLLQVEYTVIAPKRTDEVLNKIVFTNCANDFNIVFSSFGGEQTPADAYQGDPLVSNIVQANIMPPVVLVGGDVWIDADNDGVQNDGAQSWYYEYDIVKDLHNHLTAKLNTSNDRNNTYSVSSSDIFDDNGGNYSGTIYTDETDYYGILHFEFHDLYASRLTSEGHTDIDHCKNWTVDQLVGSNPYDYFIEMSYDDDMFTKTGNTVSPRGSYLPTTDMSTTYFPEADRRDDNFTDGSGGYQTENFFLHQTTNAYDMTKDIGFNIPRTLKLKKTNENGRGVNDAVFEIYGPFEVQENGPFEEPEGRSIDDAHKVATVTTETVDGVDGVAVVEGLNFFKEYVIVEKEAPEGYSIDGATASDNVEMLEQGKWLLKVPETDRTPDTSGVVLETVTVMDPENIDIGVKKNWNGDEDLYDDRPASVTVELMADGKKAKDADGNDTASVTLDSSNNFEMTPAWTNLPKNKVDDQGVVSTITYTVVETLPENGAGYQTPVITGPTKVVGDDGDYWMFEIDNTPITTSLEVNKEWIDEEPAIAEKIKSVSFKVQRSIDDGETWMDLVITDPEEEGQEAGQAVILTIDKEETTAYIDNLPTHSAEGDAYLYRAVEIGYTLKDGTFVKVKYDENTETSGTVGAYNYTSETINPGEGTDPTEPTEPELPQRGVAGDGTEGPGETPETTDGYVTNVTNKTIRGAIKVTKTWKNDSDNNRPKSLKIQLTTFAGKNKITLKGIKYSTELTSANNWTDTTTWEKVPVLDEYGNKIIYMLEEPEVNRYSASYQIVYNNKELESGSSRAFSTDVYENGVIEGRLINRYNPPANKTGDDAPLAAAGGALAVGLAGLAAVLARKKRRV